MYDEQMDLGQILDLNIPVLIYAGEFDGEDGASGQNYWLK